MIDSNTVDVCLYDHLLDFYPLLSYEKNGKHFIPLKHSIYDDGY